MTSAYFASLAFLVATKIYKENLRSEKALARLKRRMR